VTDSFYKRKHKYCLPFMQSNKQLILLCKNLHLRQAKAEKYALHEQALNFECNEEPADSPVAAASTISSGGVDLCQTLGGPNPFPPHPYPLPLPLPSLLFLSPSPPLGVRGLRPRKIFFRFTCSHASFSAFLTQKSAVYLTRFPDNNFAFLQ
jgi:hypothetical protein